MKFTSVISEVYQISFAQRKFLKNNALTELTKSFQKEVWLLIIISLIILSFTLSLKYYLLTKKNFWYSFTSSLFHLIGYFLLNVPG